ncbi:hypothetical protein ACFQGT_02690 [Natrialbaceae archaeon GCM10025810]|uniref:hypothetical protein n=1 Tax=Halovalidus salilacus TaxID=3075124 RepID=UPI003621C740
MPTITVTCPYCDSEARTSIPDGAESKGVVQSYKTGIWGRDKLVEVSCDQGHHFGVPYE